VKESKWLPGADPHLMLEFLRGKASDRKLRLFACACCRYVWDNLTDESRRTVELIEQFEEGGIAYEELSAVSDLAAAAISDLVNKPSRRASFRFLAVVDPAIGDHLLEEPVCQLIREVLGNPFRHVVLESAWRTPTVTALATAAYEERSLPAGTFDPARLAVLSDALEDAGCTNEQILVHLREPSPHVRGCWVIDLLLGKE
jgi:hypothetical protein